MNTNFHINILKPSSPLSYQILVSEMIYLVQWRFDKQETYFQILKGVSRKKQNNLLKTLEDEQVNMIVLTHHFNLQK